MAGSAGDAGSIPGAVPVSDVAIAPDVAPVDALPAVPAVPAMPAARRGVADARRDAAYVGLPFIDGGRLGKDATGADCWGLVKTYLEEEMLVADLPDYGGTPALELLAVARDVAAAQGSPTWIRVDRREARRGDVVTMVGRERVDGRMRNLECHVGVLVDQRRVLHVEDAAASAIVRLAHPSLRHRIAGFYRHKDLA